MMNPTAPKVLTMLTGLVIAGEALALVVGMRIMRSSANPWVSVKNDVFLLLDVIAGLGLAIVAAGGDRLPVSGTVLALALISMVAHGYREWEVLVRALNPFCANGPLFVLNSLKLAALIVIALVAVGLRMTPRH